MSAVVVLSGELIAKVSMALSEMAVKHPRSIAANVRPENYADVVNETARIIDTSFPDFECALIAAVSRVKESIAPGYFFPRRSRKPNNLVHFFPKKSK